MFDAGTMERRNDLRGFRPDSIGNGDKPPDFLIVAHRHHRATRARKRIGPLQHAVGVDATLLDVATRTEPHFAAGEAADDTAAGDGLDRLGRFCDDLQLGRFCQDRASNRMLAARLQGRCGTQNLGFAATAERDDLDDLRPPFGERARLVHGNRAEASWCFEVNATLHQHTLFRRSGEGRHNRYRRRDHERARTGDNEEHKRPVEPDVPGTA